MDVWRVKSNQALTLMCPPKSRARTYLTQSFVFAVIQDEVWVNIGLMYLNPVRVTYCEVSFLWREDNGDVALSVELNEEKMPKHWRNIPYHSGKIPNRSGKIPQT